MKTNRRSFLRISGTGAAAAMVAGANSIELVAQASRALGSRTPDDVASDEMYWRDIQSAFSLDRSLINLNNGNSCPSPTVVHEAYKRYLDYSNQAPVYHRGLIERNIEVVRRLTPLIRDQRCDYDRSLAVLSRAKQAHPERLVKSSTATPARASAAHSAWS